VLRTACLLLVVLLATACSGGGGSESAVESTTAEPPATTEAAPTTTEPEPFPDVKPGQVLARFVRAARARNTRGLWQLLSAPSQRRLGPTFEGFAARAAPGLARQVGVFVPGRSRVFLDEPITSTFAVAAYGGRTTIGEGNPFGSYAAALRLEDGGWRIELGGPVQLSPLGPDPGSSKRGTFQLAAGVEANAAVAEAGIWLDGRSVPGRTAGAGDARQVTLFGDSTGRIPRGPHAVVAFASTFADATALAWMFTYRGGSGSR